MTDWAKLFDRSLDVRLDPSPGDLIEAPISISIEISADLHSTLLAAAQHSGSPPADVCA
jgi:hypothetical protein